MANDIFIRCEGLVKIYKVANLEVFALQGLDLMIQRGELLGIVGASGSGKSTLMNILGGLDRPSAGRVWVDGVDLLKLNEMTLNRYRSTKVGFVWQQGARNLISYLSALENVKLPNAIGGKGSQINASKRAEDRSTWSGWPSAATTVWPKCLVASSSAWPLQWRWPTSPPCCWPTSRPAR